MSRRAEEILDLLLSGSPFYQIRVRVNGLQRDRAGALELIDCMERQCRRRIVSRDDRGIPASPERIRRIVDGLEEARTLLEKGLTPGYVLKRVLLVNGG